MPAVGAGMLWVVYAALPGAGEAEAYYPSCAAARSAGVAPLRQGEPGYRSKLDSDGDGIACEPYRGW